MAFRGRKVYGLSKRQPCPFCERIATHKNEQGLEVCHAHKEETLDNIKCTCGSWLDMLSGKFGTYFRCINCGNVSFRKAMEIREIMKGR